MLGALLVAAAAASPAPALSPDPKADAILAAARAYVSRRFVPDAISYRIVVALTPPGGGPPASRTYDSGYDALDDAVYTHAISEEENAHPFTPRGIDVILTFSGGSSTGSTGTGIQLNKPGDLPDVLGVPKLSPTYAFGLARDATPASGEGPGGLREIGHVNATAHTYDASYLGDETVDGETCAHLRLVPSYAPERLRLRELWVASDGAPLRAVTHGNFTSRPWDGLDWVIRFRRDGSALYIESETTQSSVRVDRWRRGFVSVTFRDIVTDDVRKHFLFSEDPANAVSEPTPAPAPP